MAERPGAWYCTEIARSTGRPCRRYRMSYLDRLVCWSHADVDERRRHQARARAGDEARRARWWRGRRVAA